MIRAFGIALIVVGIIAVVISAILFVVAMGNQRDATGFFIAFGIAISFGILSIIAGFVLKNGTDPSKPGTNGRVAGFLADADETRFLGDIPFVVHYQTPISGKNGRPSILTVRMDAISPTTLAFNVESWWDRVGKSIGIAREYQTGDAKFDAAVYVRSPSEDYAAEYLDDAEKRVAVRALMRLGFPEIKLTGTHLEAVWTGFDPLKSEQPELADGAAEIMTVLANRLPPDDPELAGSDSAKPLYVFLWILVLLFAATGIFSFIYTPIRTSELLLAGLKAFAAEYVGFGVLAALMLRGASISHDRWGLIMFWGFFLIGFGSMGSLAAANALADTFPLEEHIAVVKDRRMNTGKRGSTYFAIVDDWDNAGDRLEFRVAAHEYNMLAPNRSRLQLHIGPGLFGIEWLHSQQVLP